MDQTRAAAQKGKTLNINDKYIYLLRNKRQNNNSPISHLPATEVRRIVRQNPYLASDFIVIRPTAMTALQPEFGPPVRVLVCFFPSSRFAGATVVFFSSRQLNNLNGVIGHGKHSMPTTLIKYGGKQN